MAVEDGAVLTRALTESPDIPAALRLYQHNRLARTTRVVEESHANRGLFHLETIVKMLNCFTKGTEAKAKGYYRPQPYTSRYSAAQLKRMGYRMGAGDGERIVGVFMDWVSIYQDHPRSRRGPAVQQTPKEREASAAALGRASEGMLGLDAHVAMRRRWRRW